MKKFLIIYLVITGIFSSLALSWPPLVVFASFFIVPGLILMAAPTAFLWGSIYSIFYFPSIFLLPTGWPKTTALAATAVALCLISLPSLLSSESLRSQYRLDNIEPTSKIRPYGDIRIDASVPGFVDTTPNAVGVTALSCDSRCLALLFEPAVNSVTMTSTSIKTFNDIENGKSELVKSARSYHLRPRGECKENSVKPDLTGSSGSVGETVEDSQAILATWQLKLLTEVCLARETPVARYDMMLRTASWHSEDQSRRVRSPWGAPQGVATISTSELRATDGKLIFRRAEVSVPALSIPIYIAPIGGIETFHFGWGTQNWPWGSRPYPTGSMHYLVGNVLKIQRKLDPASGMQSARQSVRYVLGNASMTASELTQITSTYMELLVHARTTTEDVDLVRNIMQDSRLSDFPHAEILPRTLNAHALNDLLPSAIQKLSRQAIIPDRESSALGVALELWPEGAFANPDSETLSLLANPMLRMRTPGLIVRLSDMGNRGAPILAEILKWHLDVTASYLLGESRITDDLHSRNSQTIQSSIKAMCQLGPLANGQLSRMMELENRYHYAIDRFFRRDWDRMMLRLGKPLTEITLPIRETESYRTGLERWISTFNPKRSC